MKIRNLTLYVLLACAFCLGRSGGAEDPAALKLVKAARAYVGLGVAYDGSYRVIIYPAGDPGGGVGACTDLVVRAYRAIGLDLQVLVHEDMVKEFDAYPARRLYEQTRPDTNIDHRRCPNLMAFFKRHAKSLTTSLEPDHLTEWRAGDIVIFDLLDNGIPSHIGIVSDQTAPSGRPLIIHHFPPLPTEDDSLARWKIVGHFRYFP
ncbi:MAG TPA: DUF1287 domain-containing protein [bacterium]|nr:DUF1287 domain-containing protein [bacterium]